MQEFTRSMKFIVSFLVIVLFLNMFTSNKMTYSFLVLVLLSMLVINYEKLNTMIGGLKYE